MATSLAWKGHSMLYSTQGTYGNCMRQKIETYMSSDDRRRDSGVKEHQKGGETYEKRKRKIK